VLIYLLSIPSLISYFVSLFTVNSSQITMAVPTSKMDRGTDALKAHLTACPQMDVRQTRRGFLMELLCPCEARNEFKYFIQGTEIASSVDDSSCLLRWCCKPCYPFEMTVKESNTQAELIHIDRPFRCAAGACKCCCYQTMSVSSGGQLLGAVTEQCYYCVPSYKVTTDAGVGVYKIHPPTCLGVICINCCAEGNPCGRGCCKISFRIYPADATNTNGDAPYLGKILKQPKSLMTEVFTDANSFLIDFPANANVEQKAILMGTSIFLNAVYFEGQEQS
jgi:hypothetical protein